MARYKDVEGYRKLFDEEYKKTRKLISEGETHLDNLAEGFSEASRVIDRMPTADVVPKSEVEKLEKDNEDLRNVLTNTINKYRNCKAEVAREIFEEIERFLYLHFRFCKEEIGGDDTEYVKGRLELNTQIQNFIAELKKKYTESENG